MSKLTSTKHNMWIFVEKQLPGDLDHLLVLFRGEQQTALQRCRQRSVYEVEHLSGFYIERLGHIRNRESFLPRFLCSPAFPYSRLPRPHPGSTPTGGLAPRTRWDNLCFIFLKKCFKRRDVECFLYLGPNIMSYIFEVEYSISNAQKFECLR